MIDNTQIHFEVHLSSSISGYLKNAIHEENNIFCFNLVR